MNNTYLVQCHNQPISFAMFEIWRQTFSWKLVVIENLEASDVYKNDKYDYDRVIGYGPLSNAMFEV